MKKKYLSNLWLVGMLAVVLSGCSLAGDIQPPADYEQVRTVRQTAQAPVLPVASPNAEVGAQVYSRYCLACHGETGQGDGPSAAMIVSGVPAFTDVSRLVNTNPVDWYQLIGQGGEAMPPFAEMLTPAERWDVIAYIYHLGYSAEQIKQGQQVFEADCKTCHIAGGSASDWSDPARLAGLSDEVIFQTAAQGVPPNMPEFATQRSEADLRAAAAYIRSEIFVRNPMSVDVTMPASEDGAVITGSVYNITNSSSTAGLEVNLLGFDTGSGQPIYTQKQSVSKNGTYRFENIEPRENCTYVVVVTYQGVQYSSTAIEMRELINNQTATRPIEVFEASRDQGQLSVERRHIFLDFTEDGNLQVVEMMLIHNASQVAFVGAEDGGAVLEITLPADAQNLRFDDSSGSRFSSVPNGFIDTMPVQPGSQHQILFAYDLPYTGKLDLALPVTMNTDQVLVMLPESNLKAASSQLTSMGQQPLDGVTVNMFSASNLAAGSALNLEISGRQGKKVSMRTNSTTNLGIGLLALGLVMALALWRYSSQRKAQQDDLLTRANPTAEELMDAIIVLDDSYQSGELSEECYQTRRAELKTALSKIAASPRTDQPHD